MSLEAEKKRLCNTNLGTGTAVDQLLVAADIKPRRCRTKWQQAYHEGPTARKDAEHLRWISLRNTSTPMGRLLKENPANSQLLGGGRRAGTSRSRVRVVQKVSELACAGPQFGLPGSLEAADRVHASSTVRTMCTWISQIDPSILHIYAGCSCGRQTHRCCTVPMLRRKSCKHLRFLKTASPSSSFPCDHTRSARGQRSFSGYAGILEGLVVVDVSSILGNPALR